MTNDIQYLNDIISALQVQRDQALNAVIILQVEKISLQRKLSDYEAMPQSTKSEEKQLS